MNTGLLRPYTSRIAFLQRLLDSLMILAIYWVAFTVRGGDWDTKRILAAVLAVLIFQVVAEMRSLYNSWRTSSLPEEIRALLYVWLIVVTALLMLAFATQTSDLFSRVVVTTWFVLVPIGLGFVRLGARGLLRYMRRHGANTRSVAIVGDNSIGHRLVKHLDEMPWAGLVVNGFFDNNKPDKSSVEIDGQIYSLSAMDELAQQVRLGNIDSVYVALPLSSERRIEDVVNQLSDTTASVYVVPDLFVSELVRSRWVDFGGMPLVSVYETPFYGLYGWVKRAEDIVLGLVILTLIAPLMLVIAIAVRMTSPGAALFKQRRYGLNGAVVEVWKFRSMSVSEDGAHVPQATKGDARITPLGAFLRKTSLDELPQFINVIQGTMSVVGPRPHAIAHNEQYRKLIKGYMLRHKVKPGITGWAQVNGWRGETDTLEKMQKRVEFDLEYIQNWSVWLDLKIVFLTVFKGFVGKNVY